MEGVLALIRLYQKFTFSLNEAKHGGRPLEQQSLITLMPKVSLVTSFAEPGMPCGACVVAQRQKYRVVTQKQACCVVTQNQECCVVAHTRSVMFIEPEILRGNLEP